MSSILFGAAGQEQCTPLQICIIFKKLYNITCISLKCTIHYTRFVKSKTYSLKLAGYRFYSLHSSIINSLVNVIHDFFSRPPPLPKSPGPIKCKKKTLKPLKKNNGKTIYVNILHEPFKLNGLVPLPNN